MSAKSGPVMLPGAWCLFEWTEKERNLNRVVLYRDIILAIVPAATATLRHRWQPANMELMMVMKRDRVVIEGRLARS